VKKGFDMIGRVEKHLLDKIKTDGAIHITLLDPEKVTPNVASYTAHEAEAGGSTAIMVGGSTVTSSTRLDHVVKAIKKTTKIPVILFPNNITGISRYADAIWFMSLLNSADPYFITGAQVLGAPLVKRFGLEAIPLGYIIVGEGESASVIGRACPIPYDKHELAAAHVLTAQYLGMHFAYLEAGSGAKKTVRPEMIRVVKGIVQIPLIIGGGIKTGLQAREIAKAGADIVVTGTLTEKRGNLKEKISSMVASIKKR